MTINNSLDKNRVAGMLLDERDEELVFVNVNEVFIRKNNAFEKYIKICSKMIISAVLLLTCAGKSLS